MTPIETKLVTTYPFVEITYQTAEREFGGQVIALMDRLANSKARGAKELHPRDFNWKIHFKRCPDPPESVTDPETFTAYLCANSQAWLKATGKGWIGVEELNITPQKIMANYEQRATTVCQQRLAAKREPATISHEDLPYGNGTLTTALDGWCKANRHDKRLEAIARAVLQQLILSAED